jgi:ABC-type transporter MlaC component
MVMRFLYIFIFVISFSNGKVFADEASNWLKKEIDVILESFRNQNISKEKRFLMIENTVNYNFAGAGIARVVAGRSWNNSEDETKKEFVKVFKRHLALYISLMMQGYSNQEYKLINSKFDSKNKVSLIDMEIFDQNRNLIVTWRVKKSKDRFFIIDILVADISLVVAKRSEFNSMLKKVDNKLNELNFLLKQQNEENYNKIVN